VVRSLIMSRMLAFLRSRASRSAAVSPSPISWMNTLRGLYSIGSGLFGAAYEVVTE
jgi:hypothetical protein